MNMYVRKTSVQKTYIFNAMKTGPFFYFANKEILSLYALNSF